MGINVYCNTELIAGCRKLYKCKIGLLLYIYDIFNATLRKHLVYVFDLLPYYVMLNNTRLCDALAVKLLLERYCASADYRLGWRKEYNRNSV